MYNTVEQTIYAFVYISYIACGSASLYIKTPYFFIFTFFMLTAATVANIKIRYDAKTPQCAIFGTGVICVFHSIQLLRELAEAHYLGKELDDRIYFL